jgi:hypothetical protein
MKRLETTVSSFWILLHLWKAILKKIYGKFDDKSGKELHCSTLTKRTEGNCPHKPGNRIKYTVTSM